MPVSKKPNNNQVSKQTKSVHDFIVSKSNGGRRCGDEIYFQQVRIAQKYIDQIDQVVQKRRVKTARHAWLLEAIFEKLDREQTD